MTSSNHSHRAKTEKKPLTASVDMFDESKHNKKITNGSKKPLRMVATDPDNMFYSLEDFVIFLFLDFF